MLLLMKCIYITDFSIHFRPIDNEGQTLNALVEFIGYFNNDSIRLLSQQAYYANILFSEHVKIGMN